MNAVYGKDQANLAHNCGTWARGDIAHILMMLRQDPILLKMENVQKIIGIDIFAKFMVVISQ